MAERSYLWPTTGTGDGPGGGYPYTQIAEMMEALYPSGVLWGLSASASGFNVTISAGKAIVQGVVYTNDAPLTLTAANPGGGNTRRDLVVLSGNASARTVRLAIKQGTVNSGAYPTLQQDASYPASGIWEIQIARLLVTSVGATLDGGPTITAPRGVVDTAQIADNAITTAKIASGAVATVDLADAAVTTAKIADAAVTDAKAGDRVAALIRRQGGDATNWGISGTTNYTPGRVIMQCGVIPVAVTRPVGGAYWGGVTVYFPQAFSASPVVIVNTSSYYGGGVIGTYTDRVECGVSHDFSVTLYMTWLAIGPM